MSITPETILVYTGLDLVGDGLMKLPFLRALRHAYPQAHITWLAGKGRTVYAGILAPLVDGLIDEIIEDAGIGSAWRELLSRPLPGRRFDLIIDTQRRVKTTLILRRIGHGIFISGAADFRLSDRTPKPYAKKRRMVDALLDLVGASANSPLPRGKAARSAPHPTLSPQERVNTLTLDAAYTNAAALALPDGPYIGLSPGAGGVHKRWPLDRFIALALAVQQKNLTPVFLLGPDEAEWRTQLAASVPGALFPLQSDAVPADLRQSPLFTIALGQRLSLGLANDSGTGHMLAAADVRLISLFGPTDPGKFAPYVTQGVILRAQDFGGDDMDAIPVSAVIDAVQTVTL